MKVEVKDGSVETVSFRYKQGPRAGSEGSMRKQRAWVDVGKAYPVEVQFMLEDSQVPFGPGQYELTRQCFYLNKFNELQVDLKHMQPVKPVGAVTPARAG